MKVNKYVQLAFAFSAIVGWILAGKFATFLFDVIAPDWNLAVLGEQFRIADFFGLVVGVGLWVYLRMEARIVDFSREVATELSKVTWPARKEVKTSTIVVVATSVVISLLLGFFDYVWGLLTSLIYSA